MRHNMNTYILAVDDEDAILQLYTDVLERRLSKADSIIARRRGNIQTLNYQNDINYKIKHAREFLSAGKHVKFRVFLRGREMSNPRAGIDVLNSVWPLVEDIGDKEHDPKFEGRYVNMYVVPKKK